MKWNGKADEIRHFFHCIISLCISWSRGASCWNINNAKKNTHTHSFPFSASQYLSLIKSLFVLFLKKQKKNNKCGKIFRSFVNTSSFFQFWRISFHRLHFKRRPNLTDYFIISWFFFSFGFYYYLLLFSNRSHQTNERTKTNN